MWKIIKKVVSGIFEIFNTLFPLLCFIIVMLYLTKEACSVNDFMWFLFFLLVLCTDKIVDAIKELKQK